MRSAHRIILGMILGPGLLAVTIPKLPGQNPNNPKGIDVYAGTGTINWTSVKNSGVSFAFLKATQGTYYQDANYATNRTNANAQGIVIGAYHFADPTRRLRCRRMRSHRRITFTISPSRQKATSRLVCDWEVNYNSMSKTIWAPGLRHSADKSSR